MAQTKTDRRLIQLSPDDNVCAAARPIEPGEALCLSGQTIVARDRIPTGHKMAVVFIAEGTLILKYGAPIGSATQPIQPGDYVHTHNVRSNYLPTFTLDGAHPFLTRDGRHES